MRNLYDPLGAALPPERAQHPRAAANGLPYGDQRHEPPPEAPAASYRFGHDHYAAAAAVLEEDHLREERHAGHRRTLVITGLVFVTLLLSVVTFLGLTLLSLTPTMAYLLAFFIHLAAAYGWHLAFDALDDDPEDANRNLRLNGGLTLGGLFLLGIVTVAVTRSAVWLAGDVPGAGLLGFMIGLLEAATTIAVSWAAARATGAHKAARERRDWAHRAYQSVRHSRRPGLTWRQLEDSLAEQMDQEVRRVRATPAAEQYRERTLGELRRRLSELRMRDPEPPAEAYWQPPARRMTAPAEPEPWLEHSRE